MARPLPQTLFLDACVLYPAPIRDLFMGLALEGLVRLKWNRRVQEEWIHNLLQDRPDLTPEQQARIRATPEKMKEVLAFQEPLVEGYESLVEKSRGHPYLQPQGFPRRGAWPLGTPGPPPRRLPYGARRKADPEKLPARPPSQGP